MKIGIDFDNTIVSYDQVFYTVALEWDAIPRETAQNKLAIRDFLRKAGKEELWTRMQGYVYGARMGEVKPYSGFLDFVRSASNAGHSLVIISHKTNHPFLGPAYDLHGAARQWIEENVPFNRDSIFFEITKEKKLERIAEQGCHVFIDDLPEILGSPQFPKNVAPYLFDPDAAHSSYSGCAVSSWREAQQKLGIQ